MNFWSKESEFDEYKDLFFEWAKTIQVDLNEPLKKKKS